MNILESFGILFVICVAGNIISAVTRLPIPGNVFGMAILFILLCAGVVKRDRIDTVSKFLLGNMSFFFIPSGVAIISYFDTIKDVIVPFLLIICFTTIIVMGVTGQTAQLMQRLIKKKPGPAGGDASL